MQCLRGGGELAGQSAEVLAVADWLSSLEQEVVDVDRYGAAACLLHFAVHRSPSDFPAHELAYGRQEVGQLN